MKKIVKLKKTEVDRKIDVYTCVNTSINRLKYLHTES